jgi:hypothetical protein
VLFKLEIFLVTKVAPQLESRKEKTIAKKKTLLLKAAGYKEAHF